MSLPFEDIDDIVAPFELSYDEWKREDTVADFERLALECWRSREPGPPSELLRILQAALSKYPELRIDNPAILRRYEKVISMLMAASLVARPESEIREFFLQHLLDILPVNDLDLRDNLYLRFVYLGNTYNDQRLDRERIGHLVQENTERLGTGELTIPNSAQTRPATLGNCIKDYELFFPSFTVLRSLHRLQYLQASPNPRRLNDQERKLLLRLFEYYDFVRFPSVALKETGDYESLVHVPSEISQAVTPASVSVAAGVTIPASFVALNAELDSAERNARQEAKGDLTKIVRMVHDNLFPLPGVPYNRALALGSLIVLAQEGWFLRILEEPNPVREAFVKYLREEGKPEDVAAFQLAPVSSVSLGKFLKFVLVRRIRMPESDGAQVAVRIGNILRQKGKPQYFDMAYFDQSSGTFRWK